MDGDRLRKLSQLFDEAVALPAHRRTSFVERACADDPDLKRELLALLGRDDDPALESLGVWPARDDPGAASLEDEPDRLPATIGSYRVIRRIGAGGMGVVYEAEQEHPRRRVAIKTIRGGFLAGELQLRMFRREVATLARLAHPGIASIIEARRTDDGLPFFVMELVDGEHLDTYRERVLAPERPQERWEHALRLFLQICDAVHYAHQRGVVHRDLKPSNIVVVAREDASTASGARDPHQVKILDFGIARLEAAEGDESVVTRMGDVRGTLQYMSPEQASGDPGAIDVRTDVYALGIVLYSLVTGTVPYDVSELPFAQALSMIATEPPKTPREATRDLPFPKDLEAILYKALEKNPDDRYQSVFALREDVERYLARQPVLARKPTTFYHLRMAVARHRGAFSVAAALIVLLASFAIAMTVAVDRTAKERDRANREAETASQVSSFLVTLFESPDPQFALGDTLTAHDLLTRGAERIRSELTDQPLVQAQLMLVMGTAFINLGMLDQARPLFEESLDIREATLDADDPLIAEILNELGGLYWSTMEQDKAMEVLERALRIRIQAHGAEHTEVAEIYNNLGVISQQRGDALIATRYMWRALEIRKKEIGLDDPVVGSTMSNVGSMMISIGDYESARPLVEQGLAIIVEASEGESARAVSALIALGEIERGTGHAQRAHDYWLRAVDIAARVPGTRHHYYHLSRHLLGSQKLELGMYEEATAYAEESVELIVDLLGADDPRSAMAVHLLGQCLARTGESERAHRLLAEGLVGMEGVLGSDHPWVVAVRVENAKARRHLNDLGGARAQLEAALALMDSTSAGDAVSFEACTREYAALLDRIGRADSARAMEACGTALLDRHRNSWKDVR